MANPLDRLVARDTCREILACLEPMELFIAVLRCHNVHDDEITTRLHLDTTPNCIMYQARERIAKQIPGIGPLVRGRRRRNKPRRQPQTQPMPPPTQAPTRCTHTTTLGNPCQSWAMPGTHPPRCYWHRTN